MRKALILLAALVAGMFTAGCEEKKPQPKDKVRVRAPFVDVRVSEDGSTRVKAPGTDVNVEGD